MENNMETIKSEMLNETVYKKKLANGLEVYICVKKGFIKKIGMFGTKYGSIDNDFINILDQKRVQVPDGVAHFLEHKLFEQEDANALDLFAKEGISANAYTSFDHTVYYFETIDKFQKGIEMLIKLVKTPYFTEENIQKEQGIIGQEISMYEDDPNYVAYFNAIRAMYVNHPIRIDIAGTQESIAKINKNTLLTCYNTFYNPNNMFIVIIGDVDVENTISLIQDNLKLYEKNNISEKVTKFSVDEPENILKKSAEKEMGIYMPQVSIGFKLSADKKDVVIKREVLADIISEMYFSRSTDFYENEYNRGMVSDSIDFTYEGSNDFSHIIISTLSSKPQEIQKEILDYIEKIKNQEVNMKLFENTKRRKIGEYLISSENLNNSYRRIIDSILNDSKLYYDIELLNNITEKDIKEFLSILDENKAVISVVK